MTSKKRHLTGFAHDVSAARTGHPGGAASAPRPADPERSGPAMRDPYAVFAGIYDEYMTHVPYASWARYLLQRYRELSGQPARQIVDLACGTGQLLARFPARLKLAGMDASGAMLQRARARLPGVRLDCARLERRLPYRDASQEFAVCCHDSLNYLTEPGQLLRHFQSVARILRPGGLYSVDFVTLANILNNFDNQTIETRMGHYHLVWKNSYDVETRLMVSGLEFRRHQTRERDAAVLSERHVQRYYDIEEVRQLAGEAGLRTLAIEGDYAARPHRQQDNFWNLHLQRADGAGV